MLWGHQTPNTGLNPGSSLIIPCRSLGWFKLQLTKSHLLFSNQYLFRFNIVFLLSLLPLLSCILFLPSWYIFFSLLQCIFQLVLSVKGCQNPSSVKMFLWCPHYWKTVCRGREFLVPTYFLSASWKHCATVLLTPAMKSNIIWILNLFCLVSHVNFSSLLSLQYRYVFLYCFFSKMYSSRQLAALST